MARILSAALLTMALLLPAHAEDCRRGEKSYKGLDNQQHSFSVISCEADATVAETQASECGKDDPSSLLRCGVKLPGPAPSASGLRETRAVVRN